MSKVCVVVACRLFNAPLVFLQSAGESETYPLPNEKIAFLAVVAANVDSVEFLVEAPVCFDMLSFCAHSIIQNTAAHIQVESGAPLVSHGDDKTALTHVINGANPVAGEYKVWQFCWVAISCS